MKILLTGAAGFAGSYIAEALVRENHDIVALDCLTYAGKMENLDNVPRERLHFVCHDFRMPLTQHLLDYIGDMDYIIHNGAETHVKNSLSDPELFVQSNAVGTLNMLEAARVLKPKIFLYVSTDEVFGQSDGRAFVETDALNPSNPYSASKAMGEMLVRAYHKSFGVPYLITRTMNMFGRRQHSEKFVPMVIEKLQRGETIDIHADAKGQVGSRQWIHASDQADALMFLLQSGQRNDTFHIAGERRTNLEIVSAIAKGHQGMVRIVNAYKQYPGHDLHYALDDSKIRALGWKPKLTFEQGLCATL